MSLTPIMIRRNCTTIGRRKCVFVAGARRHFFSLRTVIEDRRPLFCFFCGVLLGALIRPPAVQSVPEARQEMLSLLLKAPVVSSFYLFCTSTSSPPELGE
ncbi:unnamed protein product [Amoebophrya sp. A25]|nr:unnamed protein product [Amoebophrya sp. A25]|eukprot:GSA25T00004973001.1